MFRKKTYKGNTFRIVIGITVLILMLVGGAGAMTPISSCTNISSPGEYVLTNNIVDNNHSNCININSSDVIFDGAGYTITGTGVYGPYGIYVNNFSITLTNITVKNLKVANWTNGIYYRNVNNGNISNNTASNNGQGIYLQSSSNSTVSNNTVLNNGNGIYLWYTNHSTVSGNSASNNSYGIDLWYSGSNIVIGNIAFDNYPYGVGIDLYNSGNSMVSGNTVLNNGQGIYLRFNSNSTVSGNSALNNGQGIYLLGSINSTVSGNTANANGNAGITLAYLSNSTVSGNTASNNSYGIDLSPIRGPDGNLYYSSNNAIYNNIFNNTNNSIESSSINTWNITKTTGTNVVGGSYLGGNYWGKPDGTGFSQTCTDADGDGICDFPYVFDSNNTDYLPLSYKSAVIPTPTLTVSPQSGQQGTIFQYSGNNYTPNGAIDWHVLKPDGTEYPIGSLTADSSGKLSYQYLSSCNSMVGSYTIWAIDRTTGKKSDNITQTISASPSCTGSTILGVDNSQSVISKKAFDKLKKDPKNYQFVIVESRDRTTNHTNAKNNLKNARLAGFKIASYVYLNFDKRSAYTVDNQTQKAIDNIKDEENNITFMALDIEYDYCSYSKKQGYVCPNLLDKKTAIDQLHKAINLLVKSNIRPIIYSSYHYWHDIFKWDDVKDFSDIPLWDSRYDYSPDLKRNWIPYGGWQERTGKQYQGTTAIYGMSVDFDSFNSLIFGTQG